MTTPAEKATTEAPVDLRALIRAKATRASESVTIFLDQAAATEVRDFEKELRALAATDPAQITAKQGKDIARKIEAARARMADSAMMFKFRALNRQQAVEVYEAIDGIQDEDEIMLRTHAAMCVEPEGVTWEILRVLRDGDDESEGIGGALYAETIGNAADKAGVGELSVPFSLSASSILSIKK